MTDGLLPMLIISAGEYYAHKDRAMAPHFQITGNTPRKAFITVSEMSQ